MVPFEGLNLRTTKTKEKSVFQCASNGMLCVFTAVQTIKQGKYGEQNTNTRLQMCY